MKIGETEETVTRVVKTPSVYILKYESASIQHAYLTKRTHSGFTQVIRKLSVNLLKIFAKSIEESA